MIAALLTTTESGSHPINHERPWADRPGPSAFKESTMPRKYRWPATRLDKDQMHELHCESVARGGVPITAIIAEAVGVYLNDRLDRRLEGAAQQPPVPASSSAA